MIRQTKHFTFERPGRIEQSFEFDAGYHILVFPITVFGQGLIRYPAKTWGKNNGADGKCALLCLLAEINGFALTYRNADLAGIMQKMQTTARIDKIGRGYRLRIVNVDRPGYGKSLVVFIHLMAGTIRSAKPASRAGISINIARIYANCCRKIAWFSIEFGKISVG